MSKNIKEYRKRPGTVMAIQWTGDNLDEVRRFVFGEVYPGEELQIYGDKLRNVHSPERMEIEKGGYVFDDDLGRITMMSESRFKRCYEEMDPAG